MTNPTRSCICGVRNTIAVSIATSSSRLRAFLDAESTDRSSASTSAIISATSAWQTPRRLMGPRTCHSQRFCGEDLLGSLCSFLMAYHRQRLHCERQVKISREPPPGAACSRRCGFHDRAFEKPPDRLSDQVTSVGDNHATGQAIQYPFDPKRNGSDGLSWRFEASGDGFPSTIARLGHKPILFLVYSYPCTS
jgi:hypothetical protein